MCVIHIHALICSLSKLDSQIKQGQPQEEITRDRALVDHLFDLCEEKIDQNRTALRRNTDASAIAAAEAGLKWGQELPNANYAIPERTPDQTALGQGKVVDQTSIPQFGEGTTYNGPSL